jgi:hypothetical protein
MRKQIASVFLGLGLMTPLAYGQDGLSFGSTAPAQPAAPPPQAAAPPQVGPAQNLGAPTSIAENVAEDVVPALELETTVAELESSHAQSYQVLASVLDKVPENARPAIEQAMENAKRGWQRARENRTRLALLRQSKNEARQAMAARGPAPGQGQIHGQGQGQGRAHAGKPDWAGQGQARQAQAGQGNGQGNNRFGQSIMNGRSASQPVATGQAPTIPNVAAPGQVPGFETQVPGTPTPGGPRSRTAQGTEQGRPQGAGQGRTPR